MLLALDAAEVGRAVLLPVAVDPLLVVAAAGVGEGLEPSRIVAARVEVEPGVGVLGRVRSMQISTPPICVDESLEAGEVDLDVVVDRDAERLR